ncbi:SDR family NAD(P)-dependent oxidoreductase [Nocardia sp. CDC159]|uniref:SDR family NAD(P)-dependent oxidoreductase n=1 Tax=Nocardia pulmonis TaxID=2951408 RepID=A0A9X2J3E5_9NOCA|nr:MULTISPECIES: SDR family NAD(P)-dependent oxidoreductase [Nocardia]MCM6779021.1 SDR family NAD(P)-dependent oxidoreductase [Nocardia pulmonis]MCM6791911.1 SDR family NAD(P)-dependent oxidoreductase [Nocardia sp. CDC159]
MTDTVNGWQRPDLAGKVAIVTGASRGVGRGIALALGDAGAKVYVTGRSRRGEETTEGLPGTIDDTADEVTARGGIGVAVRCDHTVDADTERLFEQVAATDGRLDLLVNNAWAGYERWPEAKFDAPFWKQPAWRWELFAGSLSGQFVASRLAAPLMIPNRSGLIVNISFTDGDVYLGQTAYDVCKSASDRMVVGMAYELRKHNVGAVALHPGFVRTERVEAAWDLLGEGPAQVVHSPEYVGRAIAHLIADPELIEVSGQRLAVGDLAVRYGFTDIDGRQIPPFRLEGRITLAARMERLNRVVAAGRTEAAK